MPAPSATVMVNPFCDDSSLPSFRDRIFGVLRIVVNTPSNDRRPILGRCLNIQPPAQLSPCCGVEECSFWDWRKNFYVVVFADWLIFVLDPRYRLRHRPCCPCAKG